MKNQTMMQYFEWYLPEDGSFWRRCREQAQALKDAGVNMVWLPPAYKGAGGKSSVGYDVYDTYDLGEFDQKGGIATKYGTREEYTAAVKELQAQGIAVLTDIVLNQMMGADETEEVTAVEDQSCNREQPLSGAQQIRVWSKFTFPGRSGKYSAYQWSAANFSGTDWDEAAKRKGIFCFAGKTWNRETDPENVNYDYLMGVDLDTDCPETVKAVTDWGKWYLDTVRPDGMRLDAVKHISFDFYREWLKNMRAYAGRNFFAVGEYWASDLQRLLHYLDVTENSMALFDVPLHFKFLQAATSNGQFDMGSLFENTLVKARPEQAVTFVDNHDTQPGQALSSFIPAWFKPIAYALILLRKDGIPCVFYGDYYGIAHDNVPRTAELDVLLKLRQSHAHGGQIDYFDHASVVGFTRTGDMEHPDAAMAVLVTDSDAGSKRMKVGEQCAGSVFYDALGHHPALVTIDGEGCGEFPVNGGSVSVWIRQPEDGTGSPSERANNEGADNS